MLLADVNVYLYAHRRESPHHLDYRRWLEECLGGPQPFGVSEQVLSSVVRIATHHRVYSDPTSPADALAFCDVVRLSPAAVPIRAGERHWSIFAQLCRAAGARGNVVPDAYLAALAIEHGATWVTLDSGFHRFPGLRVRRPFDEDEI
ncbi:MAG: type II toxin-antitoxin system VapC family toxin [Acidimicrobiales bacterium]